MALLKYANIGIKGMAAALPSRVIDNYAYTHHFPKDEVRTVVDKIGVYERRFADDSICSSDLCFAAANKLFFDLNISRTEIDILLFVSQTPDFRMPATSVILQNRLGLDRSTIAFDLSLGCSAFVYALQTAYSFLQHEDLNNVLILNGETRSKVYSAKDRKTAFLFGDAGAAILVGKGEKYGKSFFSLNSDGSKASMIKIDAGGYRNPSSVEGLLEKVADQYGNIRHAEHGYMDGENVFSFVAKEVPKDIRRVAEFSGTDLDSIDYFIFHQASKIINDFLVKKLDLDINKVPHNFQKFGNTSSVSVPLTIISELPEQLKNGNKICLCAFGVGLSWGSAVIQLEDCNISEIVEI